MITVVDDPIGRQSAYPIISVRFTESRLTSDPFPAALSAEFYKVDRTVTAPWLESLLPFLPTLLPSLIGTNRRARLTQLAELTCPLDWKIQRDVGLSVAGHALTEEIFRTVPLLTAEEVQDRMAPIADDQWAQLMQLQYGGQSYYFAEQFATDGTLLPVCQKVMNIFKGKPTMTDWEVAMWWINPTGWLSDASPRQCYLEDSEAIIDAAEQEVLKDEC